MIPRRELLRLLGGAVAGPLPAQGQQPKRPIVGFLSSRAPQEAAGHTAAFLEGLEGAGYAVGRDVAIEYRWAAGEYGRLQDLAAELASLGVAITAAVGGLSSALAAKAASSAIPIIFLVGDDPAEVGLVQSLSRPGDNITGITLMATGLGGKRLDLLNEMAPGLGPVSVLVNPTTSNAALHIADVQVTALSIGRRLIVAEASSPADFEPTFDMLSAKGVRGLVVQNDPSFDSRREQLVGLAAREAIPAIYHIREFPLIGGLMSYGPSLADAYRKVGEYAGRVLKGTAPSDLPVLQPTKFELVINTKAARALGLATPTSVLARADEVIE